VDDVQPAPGLLALVGGDEFRPGNESHDRILAAASKSAPACVVATAAARSHPEAAVRQAKTWFHQFGLDLTELPVYTKTQARDPVIVALAAGAGFFYIAGGDPGLTVSVLRGSAVGDAILAAWRQGAVLAGSSAGAMALCAHTLVRQSFPGDPSRRPVPGLALVPGSAVLPHHNTFGRKWVSSARAALPRATLIGIDERTCALWQSGTWRCLGTGEVTVYAPDVSSARYEAGIVPGIPQPLAP
jgi:cyanophycinase